jgi:hypothetical protein
LTIRRDRSVRSPTSKVAVSRRVDPQKPDSLFLGELEQIHPGAIRADSPHVRERQSRKPLTAGIRNPRAFADVARESSFGRRTTDNVCNGLLQKIDDFQIICNGKQFFKWVITSPFREKMEKIRFGFDYMVNWRHPIDNKVWALNY